MNIPKQVAETKRIINRLEQHWKQTPADESKQQRHLTKAHYKLVCAKKHLEHAASLSG